MSTIDFTYINDPDFPPVDRAQVTPTVDQVAITARTRTIDGDGVEQTTFTDTTRPTATECSFLVQQAVETVLSEMPDHLPVAVYPRLLQAIIFEAATLIELSFYREQYNQGSAKGFQDKRTMLLQSIEKVIGGAGVGQRVDSVVARSTMAEYEPDYAPPPPRVMPTLPFSIDGSPADEGQQDN